MDTTAWIWIAIAIIVVLLLAVILVRFNRARSRRSVEERKEQARRQAGRLREDAQESGLAARENKAAAARSAADAEQAAVEAERLRIEAERKQAAAVERDDRSKEKLQEAAAIDPDVDASGKSGQPHDGGVDTSRGSSADPASAGTGVHDDGSGPVRQARHSQRPDEG